MQQGQPAGQYVLDIDAANGTPFRVVLYAPRWPHHTPAAEDGEPWIVEFYDRRKLWTAHGQFTGGRYPAERFASWPAESAIGLHDGMPDWTVDADTMKVVVGWMSLIRTRNTGLRTAE